MTGRDFARTVFINCPFDKHYAPLLEATLFCIVYFGFLPRLANESLETGENRLDKIVYLIKNSMYSVHDISVCKSTKADEYFRLNMPFELGIDFGFRRSGLDHFQEKKFLIFESEQYDLKHSLSDIAGQDVEFHRSDYELVIKKVRNFFFVEANIKAPGPSRLISDYATFQGWMIEKKIYEGHSSEEAMNLPTKERLDEMRAWMNLGKPNAFLP